MSKLAMGLLAVVLSAAAAAAQRESLATLRPGDTLRVWAVQPRLDGAAGVLASLEADTLALDALPLGVPPVRVARVPFPSLRRIDVRRGTHRSAVRIVVGTAIGIGVGALVGGAVGPALECRGGCEGDFGGLAGFIVGVGVGGAAGGIAGGIIEARRVTRWEAVALRR